MPLTCRDSMGLFWNSYHEQEVGHARQGQTRARAERCSRSCLNEWAGQGTGIKVMKIYIMQFSLNQPQWADIQWNSPPNVKRVHFNGQIVSPFTGRFCYPCLYVSSCFPVLFGAYDWWFIDDRLINWLIYDSWIMIDVWWIIDNWWLMIDDIHPTQKKNLSYFLFHLFSHFF